MKKLLRPLHRQRTRRRNDMAVLNSLELLTHFAERGEHIQGMEALEAHLRASHLPYHRDSQGEIWVSLAKSSLSTEAGKNASPADP